jgi:hypothetical protein
LQDVSALALKENIIVQKNKDMGNRKFLGCLILFTTKILQKFIAINEVA